jgi:hypothetical protein
LVVWRNQGERDFICCGSEGDKIRWTIPDQGVLRDLMVLSISTTKAFVSR